MICPDIPRAVIALRSEATLARPAIALGDVADLSSLSAPIRARAERLEIGGARMGTHDVDGAALLANARARMPLLGCFRSRAPRAIRIRFAGTSRAQASVDQPPAAAPWRAKADIQPGDRLEFTVSAGPVRVTRRVEALQPARPGERLFVRDAGGRAFPIRHERSTR